MQLLSMLENSEKLKERITEHKQEMKTTQQPNITISTMDETQTQSTAAEASELCRRGGDKLFNTETF